MKIHIFSDLHREFGDARPTTPECDLVIAAGDIATKTQGVKWLREFFRDKPVLTIAGNHEFYGGNWPSLIAKMKEAANDSQVRVLENESCEINGWRFFGATLWTDFAISGRPAQAEAVAGDSMNDFKRIHNSDRGYCKLLPQHVRSEHLFSVCQLREFLATGDPRKSVVITHHAPSSQSLRDNWSTDLLSAAYGSNLEPLIEEFQPLLWIHGHVHHSRDYWIRQTRVICNPHGYIEVEPNPDFIPDLVVDLEELGNDL